MKSQVVDCIKFEYEPKILMDEVKADVLRIAPQSFMPRLTINQYRGSGVSPVISRKDLDQS
jgi:hypothetical protein